MKLHHRLTSVALIAMAMLVASCGDKSTNPNNNPSGPLELNSGDISTTAGSNTFAHMFANGGTYPYRCTRHGGMTGSVQVQAGHPANASVSITDNQFTPSTALVAPGGMVTWTNNGTMLHTVTSN